MNNLTKRVLVGLTGIPLILAACYFGGLYLLIFSVAASSIALWEFYTMMENRGYRTLKLTGVAIAGLFLISFQQVNPFYSLMGIVIFFMTGEISKKNRNPVNPMISVFGITYITCPFIMLNMLERTPINIPILIFVLIWTCDSMAYFGGRIFGKRPLSEISPKKTIEGSVIGFIFTIMVSLAIHFIEPHKINFADAIAAGIIVGIFAQTGDLFESMIKRHCEVKDSSGIIPGHGGVLDRFDSLLFVTPLIFIYFVFIKHALR